MTLAQVSAMIRRGFAKIVMFSGRDNPSQFWPYAIFVALIAVIVWVFVMMAVFADFLDPNTAFPGQLYSAEELQQLMVTAFHRAVICLSVLSAAVIVLLAAAVARRLHDRGLSGLWGLLPLPFLVAGIVLLVRLMDHGLVDGLASGPIAILATNNLVYLAALAALMVLLVLRGKTGPNRYGAEPLL